MAGLWPPQPDLVGPLIDKVLQVQHLVYVNDPRFTAKVDGDVVRVTALWGVPRESSLGRLYACLGGKEPTLSRHQFTVSAPRKESPWAYKMAGARARKKLKSEPVPDFVKWCSHSCGQAVERKGVK